MNTYLDFADDVNNLALYSGEYKVYMSDGSIQKISNCSRYIIKDTMHDFKCRFGRIRIPMCGTKKVERIK